MMIWLGIFFCTFFSSSLSLAEETSFYIHTKEKKYIFSPTELLKRSDLEQLQIKSDPAYFGQVKSFQAIKVVNLFKNIKIAEDAVIQFKALDGFSAPLAQSRLLNTAKDQSIAYIAIEPTTKKWPPLTKDGASAGPFYLIWKNPELSNIGPEEWPYMLIGFEVKGTLEAIFPKIFPSDKLDSQHIVQKGFRQFVKHCFACHTLNKEGAASMGPDLNIPMSPTEYFQEATLKKLIRNPQDVRHWPNAKMKGFDKTLLSDDEVDQIISYLKHMSTNKI